MYVKTCHVCLYMILKQLLNLFLQHMKFYLMKINAENMTSLEIQMDDG